MILDPDYARALTIIRKMGADYGYAIAIHGSGIKDLDLIAIPWTEQARDPQHLVDWICDVLNLRNMDGEKPMKKPHGRLAYALHFQHFHGDPRYIDFCVMPMVAPSEVLKFSSPTTHSMDTGLPFKKE